jgi:hypothetical protein
MHGYPSEDPIEIEPYCCTKISMFRFSKQRQLEGGCRRARLGIDFSTDWICISHASDVLGVRVRITSALLRTETERSSLVQRGLISGFLGRLGRGSDSHN